MTEHNQYTYDFDTQFERVLKICNKRQPRKPKESKKNKKDKTKYTNIDKSYYYPENEYYPDEDE